MGRGAMQNSIFSPTSAPCSPAAFGLAGRSGSGKTTLIEAMLVWFQARRLSVNVVKHSHHDLSFEPPSKDSARFRAAGASEVLVASPYRFAIMRELRGQPEPSLAEQLTRLAPADLTLVEGFKQEAIPRIEVWRPASGAAPLHLESGWSFVGVASDVDKPSNAPEHQVWLPLNEPAVVAAFICAQLGLAAV